MNLKQCSKCNKIINIDDLEDVDPTSIIGCGLKEDDFDTCNNCPGENSTDLCEEMRDEGGWTKTTAKEYYGVKSL